MYPFRNHFVLLLLLACAGSLSLKAQFPYSETFTNATTPGLVVSGSAKLTAATGIDPAGQGYLRLNENVNNSIGYMYGQDSFPSNYGLTVSFEFFCWKAGATSTNQADGMTFFLFDASVNAFRPGGTGGSLGYAQYYSTPGLAKGYIGISVDEFGNFSSASDGNKNGGPGQQRGSVAIRGPGNGKAVTDYVYQTGVIASDPAYNAGFAGFTQRFPDPLNANYRKLKVIMTPGSSLGSSIGYKVTVIMYKGGATLTPVTLINNFDYPFVAPAKLQFGLAASTGSITNYHEVRNMTIDVTNSGSLVAATAVNDAGAAVCQGQQAIIDVTANDVSNNTGGSINKTTVDLDLVTSGIQSTYTDAGKGTFVADSNGIVTFSPVTGFTGSSVINYTVKDNYGILSAPATISVTAGGNTGPDLAISNPPAACAPALIDITNASWKTSTSPGATYSYFATLADANNGTNNINAFAGLISIPGTYYIRALLNGCATIKPIVANISLLPTTANAGSDQAYCSSSGSQSATLLSTNADIGTGAWSLVSGPAGASITYPDAATSPLTLTQQGVYTFRWAVINGACPLSFDDMVVSVGNTVANAGPDQILSNVNQITLAGNAAAVGAGKWTLVSSPAGSTVNINQVTNPASTVQVNRTGNYSFRWTMTNGTCSNNSVVNASILTLLPVQLIGFTGSQVKDHINLEWRTASESNSHYFEVERSLDGIHFNSIQRISAKGNSSTANDYQYSDPLNKPEPLYLYYRLKQVDMDGHYSYSTSVKVSVKPMEAFNCWPNPVQHELYISLQPAITGPVQVNIYNANGLLLNSGSHMITAPLISLKEDKLGRLAPGIIVVEIITSRGSYRQAMVKMK